MEYMEEILFKSFFRFFNFYRMIFSIIFFFFLQPLFETHFVEDHFY